ncbi:MAG TPA: acyl carrier protein [Ktedonobacterales bacterium]|jgi:acyl carrier protein|nr:acyl carrier protein [Ktedonobacterales bacterium]
MSDPITSTTAGMPAATDPAGIRQQIRDYVRMNFLFDGLGVEVDDTTSLIEYGIVDTTGIVELALFVEDVWGLTVEKADLTPENFDSIDALTAYVTHRLGLS